MDARLRRASIAPVRNSTTEELNVGVASPDKADKLRRNSRAAKVEAVDWPAFEQIKAAAPPKDRISYRCSCGPFPLHMLFLLLFTAWIVNSRDSEHAYVFVDMLRERVMRHEIHQQDDTVKTTLMDIASVEQVKQYLRGPLINAIFGDQESTASGPFDVGYVMTDARMLGAARIRQIRVATNSCTVSQFQNLVPTCYAKLSDGRRRKANIYGENLGGGMRRVYKYTEANLTELPYVALVNGYMPGGYQVDIPARRLHAAALMDQLDRDNFISIETRALLIDFTIYNANINTFCVVRLTFELLHTGGVLPYADMRTARLLPYQGDYGNTQLALDGLIVAWVSASVMVNLKEAVYARREGVRLRKHLTKKWVLLEWVFIGLFWGVLSMKYYIRRVMTKLEDEAPFDPNVHYSLYEVGLATVVENNLLALEALLTYLKVFKYLSNMPIVRRLLHALDAAFKDMTAFVIVFLLVMLAFSMAFHIGFGLHLYHYRGLGTTFMTLVRFALGDVDINQIISTNDILATLLMSLFTFLIYLQMLGIAVAVLLRYYATQPSDKQAAFEFISEKVKQRNEIFSQVSDDAKLLKNVARDTIKATIRRGANRKRRKEILEEEANKLRRSEANGLCRASASPLSVRPPLQPPRPVRRLVVVVVVDRDGLLRVKAGQSTM